MQKFQSSFLSTCEGKSTEQLWQEFTDEIDQIVKTYVTSKTHKGRKNLPRVTQEIRRKMNHRDHLYQMQKKIWEGRRPTKVQKDKYEVDSMINTSHSNYLDSLFSIIYDYDSRRKFPP